MRFYSNTSADARFHPKSGRSALRGRRPKAVSPDRGLIGATERLEWGESGLQETQRTFR